LHAARVAQLHRGRERREVLLRVVGPLVLYDERAAALDELDQTLVVGDEVGARLRGAHADDDGVEAREVAGREVCLFEQRHPQPHPTESFRHFVAAPHHVADVHIRDAQIEDANV
jgi:hypothetical protein